MSSLHSAARDGDIVRIKALLPAVGDGEAAEIATGVDSVDQHKRTPLHLAAFFGHTAAAELLMDRKADPGKQAMDAFLPSHFAAQQGHLDVLKALVRRVGARSEHGGVVKRYVNRVVRKSNKSALHLAVLKGRSACAVFLALKGASVDAKSAEGFSALDLCKSDELRRELAGKAKVASTEHSSVIEPTEVAEVVKGNTTAGGAATMSADTAVKRSAEMPGSPSAKRLCQLKEGTPSTAAGPPMSGLPVMPPASAEIAAGVVACGPFTFGQLEVQLASNSRSYPAGIAALANVQWSFARRKSPELKDGPIWCISSHEVRRGEGDERTLKIVLQKSTQKLLHYTHFSDEGKLLPSNSRCNACGLVVIAETSDGLLALQRRPIVVLEDSDVQTPVSQRLQCLGLNKESAAVSTAAAAVLALLEMGEDALEGCRHILCIGARISVAATQLMKADFAENDRPRVGSVEDLLRDGDLDDGTRRALLFLRELRSGTGTEAA
eukprot:TRINITY_DN55004_c0_g1_i1.p1 TRINITY_DN55004_c0_g1~~TRINITY_DN55004_c0_g1_i1.p1  ORF type:complete len:494 (+),score=80.35 TRINITY_DN55004_c0_g1_i1:92-1573(+)